MRNGITWPKSSAILPPAEPVHKRGDAAGDAHDAAVAARNACTAKYNPDNYQLGLDITSYNQSSSNWTRVKDQMTEPDKTNCFNALSTAFQALSTENTDITNCYDHIGAGDTNMTNGDNAGNMQMKIQFYNTAKSHYETGTARCVEFEQVHPTFGTAVDTANEILSHWG